MGWQRVSTQRGVIMTGSRSVRWRRISNEALPEPMMTAARNSVTGTPCAASSAPVSWRLARWCDRSDGILTQPAEVDDAADAGPLRRLREVARRPVDRAPRSRAPRRPWSGPGSTRPPPRRAARPAWPGRAGRRRRCGHPGNRSARATDVAAHQHQVMAARRGAAAPAGCRCTRTHRRRGSSWTEYGAGLPASPSAGCWSTPTMRVITEQRQGQVARGMDAVLRGWPRPRGRSGRTLHRGPGPVLRSGPTGVASQSDPQEVVTIVTCNRSCGSGRRGSIAVSTGRDPRRSSQGRACACEVARPAGPAQPGGHADAHHRDPATDQVLRVAPRHRGRGPGGGGRGRCTASWAPTGRARRRPSGCSWTSSGPRPDARSCSGSRPRRTRSAIHRRIGYLPGEFALFDRLTGGQTIEYFANLRGGVDPAYQADLVARFELDPSRRFREYSKGNKQKVGPGHRAPAPAGPARPRRAHLRARSARPADLLRTPSRHGRRGAHRVPVVPHPGRGGADVRPGRHHPRGSRRHDRPRRGAARPCPPRGGAAVRDAGRAGGVRSLPGVTNVVADRARASRCG